MQEEWKQIIDRIAKDELLISATFSKPCNKSMERKRVQIRSVIVKQKRCYQVCRTDGQKELHQLISTEDCKQLMEKELLEEFKQAVLFTTVNDYYMMQGKKGNITIRSKAPTKTNQSLEHNRKKEHLLKEGKIPFLMKLGLVTSEGKIRSEKADKFRQINRFLEMVEDLLPHLSLQRTIRMIDFGCGKAYLTFALYYYLHELRGYDVYFIGIDLKKDVIEHCRSLALSLGWQSRMEFVLGNIDQYETNEQVDMVLSLHACNTATDLALERAVRWKAKTILSVPCCHQELMHQIQHEELMPLLRHGILKERFSALATDAARAQLLEVLGYQTQVVEFIDLEHTAKNLMIRGVRRKSPSINKEALEKYLAFAKELNVHPFLATLFAQELSDKN